MRWEQEVQQAVAHWVKVYKAPQLTPALVHAIIERESLHGLSPIYIANHGIVPEPNGHHSYGPMQVYDTTARTLVPFDPAGLASHPELGIWYGTKHLAGLLEQFGSDTAAAVSAYNAGASRAHRPFPNQDYVNAVMGFLSRYRGAVGGGVAFAVAGALAFLWFARRGRRSSAAA